MASRKRGQKDSGQYTVYNPPTSNLDLLRTRGDKYETVHIQQDNNGAIR